MNRRSLARLIALREHAERIARAELSIATRELNDLMSRKHALLVHRNEEEAGVSTAAVIDSDELLRRHRHLEGIRQELGGLEESIASKQRDVDEREREWMERRREVKSLQTLLDRRNAELEREEKRRLQKLSDAVGLNRSTSGRNA